MKLISCETQKKIMYIPIVNYSIIPIWLYNSFYWDRYCKTFPKILMILFTTALPLALLQRACAYFLPSIGLILGYANAYIIPLIMSYRLIKYHNELMKRYIKVS